MERWIQMKVKCKRCGARTTIYIYYRFRGRQFVRVYIFLVGKGKENIEVKFVAGGKLSHLLASFT